MEGRGWKTEGIDPSPNTVSYARKEGLNVVNTTIDEASLPESSFNAVTMFYVLEHLTDPLNALRKIHNLLAPGGALIIRVPHTTPVVRLLSALKISNNLYDAPFHLFDFSPSSIIRLLEKSGFTSIRVTPGEPTVPHQQAERFVSLTSGYAAKLPYNFSGGKLLLPGVSKTTIAFKPGE
jgi:SAM-dependent methyltransferase